jgi:hypothetical protein
MSQDTQELARLRAAFTASAAAAPEPESCPAPDRIWAAVRGELPPGELRALLDHTASCAACAEDWRLAVELNHQSAEQAGTVPGRVIQGRFGRWRAMAGAAALAASLLIAVGVYRGGNVGQPGYRGAGTEVHSLLAEGQALPRQAPVLRWTPLAGASAYDVSVSTEDLRQVASSRGQAAAEYRLPASAVAGLPAGSRLLWQVDAVFPDGHHVTSPTFSTTLQ